MVAPGDRVSVVRGGDGGVGNKAFASSTNRTPRTATAGTDGEAAWVVLEFRLAVDIALVGLPNAGKSALLVALTGAAATVAPYPQSTREPALGPLEDEDGELLLVADLPGLAADGEPRDDHHLDQLERAAVVVACVQADDDEPFAAALAAVRAGIAPFLPARAAELVVATHGDMIDTVPPGAEMVVDSPSGAGVDDLRRRLVALTHAARAHPGHADAGPPDERP
ncbi:MAG: GTPase [Miltoncostaeaceae bacterium]